jgi:hypothetical protein
MDELRAAFIPVLSRIDLSKEWNISLWPAHRALNGQVW